MKKARLLGCIIGLLLFFVMLGLDKKFFIAKASVLPSNWASLVYGIDTQEEKKALEIKYITVDNDGDVQHFLTNAKTPVEALTANGYAIESDNKIVTDSPSETLTDNSLIVIKTYRTIVEDVYISIPYDKVIEGGSLCERLSTKLTIQKGVLGVATQSIQKVYEGDTLVSTAIVGEAVVSEPRKEISIVSGPNDTPDEVEQHGYNCPYWESYVDNEVSATDEEKQWLKFTMRWESGCNAESDKDDFYKGLFQWSPCQWYSQFPNDNIFDGKAQIRRTLQKLRTGADPEYMWPAVYKRYVATYGELSWLAN